MLGLPFMDEAAGNHARFTGASFHYPG